MTGPDRSRFVLFWDHIVSPTNPYHLAVFSQWFDAPFVDPSSSSSSSSFSSDGVPSGSESVFKTAEHWMMYHKAALFDPSQCSAILSAPTPAEAKRLGREIKGFDRDVWNRHADGIVQRGNWAKFHPDSAPRRLGQRLDPDQDQDREREAESNSENQGYERRKADAIKRWETLKATRGKRMVEASPEDRIWGIGYGREDAWEHTENWGLNRMGDALTLARADLLKELDGVRDDPVPDLPSCKV